MCCNNCYFIICSLCILNVFLYYTMLCSRSEVFCLNSSDFPKWKIAVNIIHKDHKSQTKLNKNHKCRKNPPKRPLSLRLFFQLFFSLRKKLLMFIISYFFSSIHWSSFHMSAGIIGLSSSLPISYRKTYCHYRSWFSWCLCRFWGWEERQARHHHRQGPEVSLLSPFTQ